MKPKRIQRKRTKGWKMPVGAVYVGRPTYWGNPHYVVNGDQSVCVNQYREHILLEFPEIAVNARRELRGKDLACWCKLDQPCHADVLLEIANSGAEPSKL